MATRKTQGAAPILTDAIRQQLAQSMQVIRRNEVPIYRGSERRPLIAAITPGYGRLLAKACTLIHDCCKARNMETDKPGAFRISKTALAGYLVAEPVQHYDKFVQDLYEVTWPAGRTTAYIDLLPILQPRNLEVPQGHVMEIPVSAETLNGNACLVLHLEAAETRAIKEMTEEQKAAMTKTRMVRKAPASKPAEPPVTDGQ